MSINTKEREGSIKPQRILERKYMLRENTKPTLFALLPLSKISIIHFPYKSPVLSPSISMPNLTNFVKIPLPHAFISLTLCFVGGIIRRMENNGWKMVWKTVFSTVQEAKEKREDGKLRRKFSSRAHQFFSSQIGRKTVERKRSHYAIIGLPSPNVCKFINSTPIFINSTSISNPENQQHTHIHQTHIKIHQTHIQIPINNQSEN